MEYKYKNIYTDKYRDKISIKKVLEEIVAEGLASILFVPLYCYMILPTDIKNKYRNIKEKYWD
jgi:hypothetical protein